MTFLLLSLGIALLPGRTKRRPAEVRTSRRALPLPVLTALGVGLTTVLLGGRTGWLLAVPVAIAADRVTRRIIRSQKHEVDHAAIAFVLDLTTAALRTGLPVEAAIGAVDAAVTQYGDEPLATAVAPFSLVARLLTLGSEPCRAWAELDAIVGLGPVAAAGRRCAHSGARLAGALSEVATDLRAQHRQQLMAKAQRTGVWSLLPLGLCFLPAFICLGVVPVVIGVAGHLLGSFS